MSSPDVSGFSREELKKAITEESQKFEKFYLWLEEHMPKRFFEEISSENLMLITHNLITFNLQEHFSQIHLKHSSIVLCLDSPEADLRVLKNYGMHGIRYYRTFVSNVPPPFPEIKNKLRIAILYFTEAVDPSEDTLTPERKEELLSLVKARNPKVTE